MELMSLPQELLVIIIKKLDFKSIFSLYQAGNFYIQNVICSQGVIKKCDFSLSTLGTVQTLKSSMFQGISKYLLELKLTGIPDLTKTLLVQAMKKLKNLSSLDVSYTNITIIDLVDIFEVCPTIKNIGIDFQFYHKGDTGKVLSEETLEKCKNTFSNFIKVYFVGSVRSLLNSNLPAVIMEHAKLSSLTYSITKIDKLFGNYNNSKPIICNSFFIYFHGMYNKDCLLYQNSHSLSKLLNVIAFKYEYICIGNIVYCSSMFKKFFQLRFNLTPLVTSMDSCVENNFVIMIFNNDTTTFDETFFTNLFYTLSNYFPGYVNHKSRQSSTLDNVSNNNWICIDHMPSESNVQSENLEPVFKKSRTSLKRSANSEITLDYDSFLYGLDKLELSLYFVHQIRNPVSISARSDFLSQLTFLCIEGSVRFSDGFFNVLFRSCNNLKTLNVEVSSVTRSVFSISRTIPLSSTLENLRLVDNVIDFKTLFSSLAQCKTLENIHIIDNSILPTDIPSPDALFKQCNNLYYFGIKASMSDNAKNRMIQMLNKSRLKFGKKWMNVKIVNSQTEENVGYSHDPFTEPFKVHAIKVDRR